MIFNFEAASPGSVVAFAPDGTRVSVSAGRRTVIRALPALSQAAVHAAPFAVSLARWSPDSRVLAVASPAAAAAAAFVPGNAEWGARIDECVAALATRARGRETDAI